MIKYDYKKTEAKWQRRWKEEGTFTPDLKRAQDPYYALFMFPYPSAEGLHIGNFYAFTCVDVMAKYMKLRGRDVFEPVGWDAFGIHSENYALKIGEKPRGMLKRTIANFRQQLEAAGLGCDWTREVDTTAPAYYKWTQWIFTELYKRGLAYRREALLNWCPSCKTVLADEQIEGGVCERCKAVPEKKIMKQWFFRITAYAERLLEGLSAMDWSEITKAAQKNWIGRSEGAIVKFKVKSIKGKEESELEVFTTRPDTLFGATYMVLAPEHPLIANYESQITNYGDVLEYIKKAGAKSDLERTENKEKTGIKLEGVYAVNPVNNEKMPVFIADYVLMGYGTGAIMAVPAHDERDWEFAKKYKIKKINVVLPGFDHWKEWIFDERAELRKWVFDNPDQQAPEQEQIWQQKIDTGYKDFKERYISNKTFKCYLGEGTAVNSGFLDGLATSEAKEKIITWLEEKGLGERKINYRLRDWCISRQRYWGPPVPVIYCPKCGEVPVPEKDLPVRLPELDKDWEPAGDGRGPLAKVESFMKTTCPPCGGPAEREPDVMDNFLDSAWYFFRYLSPDNDKEIFGRELGKKWLPVDLYVGGNEHAVLHLMYTRFITMALHDLGLIDFDNPFRRFRANGMILKDGKKMSKSKGNVVNPEEYGEKVGYDALKTYLLFLGPLSEDRSFTDDGVLGAKRWIDRIFRLAEKAEEGYGDGKKTVKKLHQTVKAVEDDFADQKYNTAIAHLMELTNELAGAEKISAGIWRRFIIMIAPFAPALSEELWSRLGGRDSVFKEKWPEYDPALARDETFNLVVQVNGKVRDMIAVAAGIGEDEAKKIALASEKIKKWIEGKEILKVIYIKGKLVNIVVR